MSSETISDKIKALMNDPTLSPEEKEAAIDEINANIKNIWADPSKHVKTLVSLPPELFEDIIEHFDSLRARISEEEGDPDYAKDLPQDVILGHVIVSGINAIGERHARRRVEKYVSRTAEQELRELRKSIMQSLGGSGIASALAAAMMAKAGGAEKIRPDPSQLDAMEQFIRSKFGPDAKIERTEDGFDVAVPSEQAPDPKDVISGIKDIFGTDLVFVERTEGEEEDRQDFPAEGCNGDCENCSKNPFNNMVGPEAETGNGEVIVADENQGVSILSTDGPAESLN